MTETNPTDLLPMRDVVSLTGINPVTLRAWERRHGLIQPHRTEGGHRLYTASDVQRIRDILRWTANGLPISKVGPLLNRQPVEQRQDDEQFADWRAALARATATYDVQALEALHGQLFTLLPKAVVFGQVLLPVWQELRGSDALGARSQWLFLDYFLRARLLLRLQLNQADAPRVLLVAGDEQPELVLLGTALVLSGEQQRIEALGGALPLEEVALVCAAAQPAALVVAMQGPLNAALAKRLRWLQMEIACPLALAGAGPVLSQAPLDGAPVCLLDTQGGDVAAVLNALLRGTLDV